APNAVANLTIDDAGRVVSGTGEAGAAIVVSDAAGNVLGTATVSAGGTFTLTLSVPQLNGETLSVIQRDTAGNPSTPATIDAPDITAPALPVVTGLSADGVTLTGTGEAGATILVTSRHRFGRRQRTFPDNAHARTNQRRASLRGAHRCQRQCVGGGHSVRSGYHRAERSGQPDDR
nr:hypothetical protein [Tanacetum cinerariifolium]